MTFDEVMKHLASLGRADVVTSMAKFGIATPKSFGIKTPDLKQFARQVKKQADDRHMLAIELWETGNYDARAVAFMIDDPNKVTRQQMDAWAADFDNWGTVDGTCCYLFCRTPFAYDKAFEWADTNPEFLKRAGFSLMAYLAIHDKKAEDDKLATFLDIIENHSDDDRNFVRKAVNWALRQIGKRNSNLNKLAVETAARIKLRDTKSARWIASDALRELKSESVMNRFRAKESANRTG